MAADGTTTDYYGQFDQDWYLRHYYGCIAGQTVDQGNLLRFNLERYNSIFQSGEVKGRQLLDIGTGPSVHSIITASRHVDDVYLSDFAAQNRKVLIDWWKSDKTLIEKITEYVLKQETSSETVVERQTAMKGKVRAVLPIDVTMSIPLGSGSDVTQFDIITSSLCLEAAALTIDQYRTNAANVASLLKVGGHFILNGVLEQTWYRVGESKFACVWLSKEDIESTFVSCGFDIKQFDVVKFKSEDEAYSDFHGYFVMHAIKI
ncbi:phenylethanolamine N-methyltransferase-like isoform X1 [Argopecten irradians]|uniref:phenylethanolamine N-methyltransferase-like isoform X1 n=1 Tax=Argopecten irradians TaxID=31199 RepID=UPI003711D375